ncbi:MAG: ribosome small subunit-dependent GTPase A [Bacteroidetes bacterium]|nr:ribosome small subunit-dependent GTPase A [Bacteroidota bacterium]
MKGLVIKSTGSQYLVRMDDGKVLLSRIRGNLRLKGFEATNPVTVGDRVEVEEADGMGMITQLHDRKNYIIRKSVNLSKQFQVIAANLDLALVVATPISPRTSLGFIDRFLSTAEAYNIPAGIVFNKSDLYDETVNGYVQELKSLYNTIGYAVFIVSSVNADSLEELKGALKDKVNLFSGHSGVGKSTLINTLIPGAELRTAEISSYQKGIHTTTFAEMHQLPFSGFVIDTPGIREFGTIDFDKYEVSHFFPEIFKVARGCKFNNCLHFNETQCAVLDAVRNNEIALSRYESYVSIMMNQDVFK